MMKGDDRFVIIMAGGRGERFWPLSREQSPKHLLSLLGKRSLLQQCFDRILPLVSAQNILVISSIGQVEKVAKQLPQLPKENLLAEPCGRDTCAAIALGTAVVGQRSRRAVMAVLPADHLIGNEEKFLQILSDCFGFATQNPFIVTIGIEPKEPATGYGYIQKSEQTFDSDRADPNCQTDFYKVRRFVEKPDFKTAAEYVKCGEYVWNAGIFVWSFSTITNAFEKHQPSMLDACFRWLAAATESRLAEVLDRDYPSLPKLSIDYAVMEKASNTIVAQGNFAWDDLGVWTALSRHLPADAFGNCVVADCIHIDSTGNLIFDARKNRMPIALVGLKDSIVVQTDSVLLVASKSDAQKIKELVKTLAASEHFRNLI